MKKLVTTLILIAVLGIPAWAASGVESRTVTLSVPGMTCATCPITVRKALQKVDGVVEVKVTWEPKEAVVTFDDARTDVQPLTEATRNAGYPSTVKPQP